MARKNIGKKLVSKKEQSDGDDYACIGGNPKIRREMKRHKDMMKKFGRSRVEEE